MKNYTMTQHDINNYAPICGKSFANERIENLFSVWLFLIEKIYNSYGERGLASFIESSYSCPIRFSYKYEFNGGYPNNKLKLEKKGGVLFYFYYYAIKFLFLGHVMMPGAKVASTFERMNAYLSLKLCKTIYLKYKESNDFSRLAKRRINDFLKTSAILVSEQKLFEKMPDVFCMNADKKVKIKKISCSPWTFFEFSGRERILLADIDQLDGYQHGGGYFMVDESEHAYALELGFADRFYGWGLSPDNNVRQYRYSRHKLKSRKKGIASKKRILWVETSNTTKFIEQLWPVSCRAANNLEPKIFIHKILKHVLSLSSDYAAYLLPYRDEKLRNEFYEGVRLPSAPEIEVSKFSEDFIDHYDMIVFDYPFSSLIYACIEKRKPFFISTDRATYCHFSKSMREWFDYACDIGFAQLSDGAPDNILSMLTNDGYLFKKSEHYMNFLNGHLSYGD